MPRRKAEHNQQFDLETWRKDAQKLSYEEALQALDLLLARLQDDSVPLADLQHNHARASIYLERCDFLLTQVEQSVWELDQDSMAKQIYDKGKNE